MMTGIGVENYLQKLTAEPQRGASEDELLCKLIQWIDTHIAAARLLKTRVSFNLRHQNFG